MRKLIVWLLKFASILWLLFVWRYGVKSTFDAWAFIGALMFYTALWLTVLRVGTDSMKQVLGGMFYFP